MTNGPGFVTIGIEDALKAEEVLLGHKLITGLEVSDGEYRKEKQR